MKEGVVMEVLEKEFIRLYNLYVDDCLRLAVSFTKNIADAEDITQKVFVKLYNELCNKKGVFNKSWLLKVTANECKNLIRWHKRIIYLKTNLFASVHFFIVFLIIATGNV